VTPTVDTAGLAQARWWEWAVRFLFGGVVTACTGVVAHRWGAGVGGLFLAFPAILPASLTLVRRHDGRRQVVDDARGARSGSLGLAAFALVAWRTATAWPPALVLAAATAAWGVTSVAAWACVRWLRSRPAIRAARRRASAPARHRA